MGGREMDGLGGPVRKHKQASQSIQSLFEDASQFHHPVEQAMEEGQSPTRRLLGNLFCASPKLRGLHGGRPENAKHAASDLARHWANMSRSLPSVDAVPEPVLSKIIGILMHDAPLEGPGQNGVRITKEQLKEGILKDDSMGYF